MPIRRSCIRRNWPWQGISGSERSVCGGRCFADGATVFRRPSTIFPATSRPYHRRRSIRSAGRRTGTTRSGSGCRCSPFF
jgi:hypothetical protein